MRSIGNFKLQTPNSKQITNSKTQISNEDSSFVDFGLWILGIGWMLDIGYWKFRCCAAAAVGEYSHLQ